MRAIGEPAFAVLSSTALHWLEPDALVLLYQRLAALVRPGGLFLNADRLAYDEQLSTHRRLAEHAVAQSRTAAFAGTGREDRDAWWAAIAEEPALTATVAHRNNLIRALPRPKTRPSLRFHRAALLGAGFSEVDVIWQRLEDRVLLAVR